MRSFLTKLRNAQNYDPYVIERMTSLLRGRNPIARAINFFLAVIFVTGRRVVHVLRFVKSAFRTALRLNHPSPAASLYAPPLTAASRDSQGRRVLIIGELTIPQCKRYRVDQKVEMLEHLGYDVTVVSWYDDACARRELQLHGLVIFYRVPASEKGLELLEEARRLGLICFFDIDDMVFDVEEYSRNTNILHLPPEEVESLLDGGRLYCDMLKACDNSIASTDIIAARMRHFGLKSVHVVENCLDARALDLAAEMRRRPQARPDGTVVIGYGSGTRTHDADFTTVADAILAVLRRHPEAVLAIHGYLTLPDSFDAVADRVFRVPFLDTDDYMRALASWHISIAPLEPSVFNEAKSNIKFLEASIMGVPSVCTPTEPFRSVIEHGRTGFLPETIEDWTETLSRLVQDADLRHRVAEAARAVVLARYHPAVVAQTQLAPVLDRLPPQPPARERPIRLLMVNVLFPPQSFGGATIVAEHLARHLPASGVNPTVLTGLATPELTEGAVHRYEFQGTPVIGIAMPPPLSREHDYRNPAMKSLMSEILATTRPDVVHLHSIQQLSASIAEACVEAGVPFIVTLHDAWWICERQFMVREDGAYCDQRTIDLRTCARCMPDSAFTHKRFYHLAAILEKAALLLAPSAFQRDLYVANGLPPDRVRVNGNGVPLPATADPARVGRTVRFAYLGGQAVHKGYFWMKEIFENLKERNWRLVIPDIHLRLGHSSIRLKDWKGRGRVSIVPPFDQDNLDAFYADIDVLLVPSLWKESFGLAVREALARNVWVITTDSGGVTEAIVEGENGNIIERGDTTGFTAAIRAILADPGRLNGYVNPHREHLRCPADQARELADMLVEVVATHTKAPLPPSDSQVGDHGQPDEIDTAPNPRHDPAIEVKHAGAATGGRHRLGL